MGDKENSDIERLIRTGLGFRDFMHFHMDAFHLTYDRVNAEANFMLKAAERQGLPVHIFIAACMSVAGGHIQSTVETAKSRAQQRQDAADVEDLIADLGDDFKEDGK